MKRSLLDPLPRQLSTKALAALVALVVCGTGVAVARFLESSQTPAHRPPASVQASPSSLDAPRSGTPVRATTRGAAFRGSVSTPQVDAGCSVRAMSNPCSKGMPVRGDEPTLARPDVEGT